MPPPAPPTTSEPQPAELLRIPLPVLGHLDVQREVDPQAEQLLDAGAGLGAHLAEAGAATPDDDGLLALAFDDQADEDRERLLPVRSLALHHLVHRDRERVRQLVADALE